LFGDFDELAIVESLGLEGLDLGIDQGHCCFLTWGWLNDSRDFIAAQPIEPIN